MAISRPIQSISGLASGLDTDGIVAKLMAIEQRPQQRLQLRQQVEQSRQDALRDVNTRLKNLLSAAAALSDPATWADKQSATSSDPARLGAAIVGGVAPGGYTVSVERLASADLLMQQAGSTLTAAGADDVVTLAVGQGQPLTIHVKGGDSLQAIATAINTAARTSKTPLQASVVNLRLVLAGQVTGAANTLAVSSEGSLATDLFGAAPKHTNGDAALTVNGVPISSATNTPNDAIPGATLALRGVIPAGNPATFVVDAAAPSTDTIQARLQDFVTQYNSTISFIRGRLNEPKVAKAGSLDEMRKGLLYGDTDLTALLRRLRQELTSPSSGAQGLNSLLDIGLGVGSSSPSGTISKDALAGQLNLDTAKLSTQLDNRLPDVKTLLTDGSPGGDGLVQRLSRLLTPYTKLDGVMDSRMAAVKSGSDRLSREIGNLDDRLALREKALRAQFTSLETALQTNQAQGTWLSGQIASQQRRSQ
jgi:flagellar hook-associated protein 2